MSSINQSSGSRDLTSEASGHAATGRFLDEKRVFKVAEKEQSPLVLLRPTRAILILDLPLSESPDAARQSDDEAPLLPETPLVPHTDEQPHPAQPEG